MPGKLHLLDAALSTIRDRTLPLGHYDISKAREVIKKEYADSWALENSWIKKLKRKNKVSYSFSLPLAEAIVLIAYICNALKISVPRTSIDSTARNPHYDGSRRTIVFLSNRPYFTTVLHELAHHFVRVEKMNQGHGKDFLFMLDLIFQVVFDKFERDRKNRFNGVGSYN